MMKKHLENIQKSFRDLKVAPIVVLPSFFLFVSMFLMIIIVIVQLLVTNFFATLPLLYAYDDSIPIGDSLDLGSINWGLLFVFLVVDVALYFLIVSYYRAIHYGTIGDVVTQGKSSIGRMLNHGRSYFLSMLSYSIAKSLVTNGILAVLLIAPLILAIADRLELALLLGSVLFILWLLFVALPVSVITTFTFPLVFDKKKGGFQILWESMTYSKKNFEHVLLTWLVTILLGVCFSLITLPIDLMASLLPPLSLVSFIITWVLGIVLSLYVFNSYFSNKKVKKRKVK